MALRARNLRHFPFTGTAANAVTHYLGATGSNWLPGGATDRYVQGMNAGDRVVAWEILNTDATNDLLVRYGPQADGFAAATGTDLGNYITIPAGQAYNFPVFGESQQLNDLVSGSVGSLLQIQGSGGATTYTGVAHVFRATDDG